MLQCPTFRAKLKDLVINRAVECKLVSEKPTIRAEVAI